jgi:hypothetical protein
MRRVVVAAMLSGCSFAPAYKPAGSDQPDAAVDPTSDGGQDVSRQCHASGTRLCLEFETPTLMPTIFDGSGFGNDGAATAVRSMERVPGELAAQVSTSSRILIPESPNLDIQYRISMEMWMRPDSDAKAWGLDNDGQYALGIDSQSYFCILGRGPGAVFAHAGNHVNVGQWSHVACTYDGYNLVLYVDGNVAGCAGTYLPSIPTNNTGGTQIGVNFASGIDDVRIYDSVLPPDEIWSHAGVTGGTMNCGFRGG